MSSGLAPTSIATALPRGAGAPALSTVNVGRPVSGSRITATRAAVSGAEAGVSGRVSFDAWRERPLPEGGRLEGMVLESALLARALLDCALLDCVLLDGVLLGGVLLGAVLLGAVLLGAVRLEGASWRGIRGVGGGASFTNEA